MFILPRVSPGLALLPPFFGRGDRFRLLPVTGGALPPGRVPRQPGRWQAQRRRSASIRLTEGHSLPGPPKGSGNREAAARAGEGGGGVGGAPGGWELLLVRRRVGQKAEG